jgi:hypothetical protein
VAPLGTAGNDGFNGVWGDPTNRINDGAWAWNSTHGFHSDGDQPTRIWVTWASVYTIDSVRLIHCEAGNQFCSADYQIQSLNPGGNPTVDGDWTTVYTEVGNTAIDVTHAFAAVATEGIRLFVTDDGPESPMRFEEMLIFGVPGVVGNTLTWDGVTDGNWNEDARWSGTKPPNFPDGTSTVEIGPNAGNNTVTVAGVREANSVAITNNGQLIIGGGHSLTVTGAFSSGTATILNTGATLSLSSGTLAGLQTAAGGGTATLVHTGSVDASHLVMANGDTFVSSGGALTFDLSGGSNSLDGTNTVHLNGGTLDMQAASNPLNGATLQLNGGTFTIEAAVGSLANALSHHGYHINNDNLALDLDNNGGMMGNGSPKDGPNYFGSALLTNGPGNRGLDFNGDSEFIATGAIGQIDSYSNLFVGTITVSAANAGNWEFRRVADDDRMGIWLDTSDNGIFESSTPGLGSNRGEQLQWDNDGAVKTVTLAQGDYLFAVTHREGGGGSGVNVEFKSPTMGARTNIKPGDAAQAGIWSALVLDPVGATDSDVEVHDSSTLNALTDTTAAFGALSYLADGKELTTTGAPSGMSFTGTTFDASVSSAEINTGTDTNLGDINDAGPASLTITKSGLSEMTLAANPTSLAATTTLDVHEGTMNADYTGGATPSGSANFLLSGGTLATTANALDLQTTLTVDVAGVQRGQLNQSVFLGVGASYADVRGANYEHSLTRTMTGDKANTVLDPNLADSHSGLATSEIQNWNTFPTFNGGTDNFLTVFSGYFIPTETGNYGFRMQNDDTEWMFFDTDHSGSFEAGEALGSQNNENTNVLSLTAGVAYAFIAIGGENGGGQSINWYVTPPNQGQDRVNPADIVGNGGYWGTARTHTALQLTDTATSNLQNLVLKAGNLEISGGSLLTVEQASISAATGGGVGLITDTNTILTNVSGFEGNSQTATLTKDGSADLVLNKAGSNLGSVTFLAEAGRLIGVSGGSNPFGTADFQVNGGELLLASDSGTARSYDNAIEVLGDGTLTAGAGGQGGNNATITVGSASNLITLTTGILTLQAQDGYSMTIPGLVSGAGGLNVTSAVTVEKALSVGSLDLSAALTRSGAAAGDRAITVGDLYLRNAAGSLTIASGETLTVNTSGLVEGGATLQLDGTMTGAGTVAVDTGSTLFGTSATVSAPVTIQSGGTIAAGAGTLGDTLDSLSTGNLTINDGGIYQWQLGATGDQIDVTGNLTLDDNWTLHLVDATAPLSLGDQLLFTYTGTATIGACNFDTSGLPANWQTAGVEIFDDGAGNVYIRNLVVTAAAVGDLTWDGTNNAESEWSFGSGVDSHWDGGALGAIPIFNLTATVDSGRVEVSAGDSAAHTLTVATTGEVEITSGRRLEITENGQINSGGLITITNGTLFANVNTDVAAGGTLTVAANGALEVIQLNNSGSSTFDAGASGNLVQLNVDAGTATVNTVAVTIGDTTVTGGTLNLGAEVPMANLSVTGGQVVAGANHAVVSNTVTLSSALYSISSGQTFGAGGTINSATAGRLNLTGGTLTIDPPGGTDIYSDGLEAWLDASTGVTVDGSNTVTLWADQSGNGRDAVQNAGTGTLTTDEINGLPAVLFNANNETLNLGGSQFFAYDTFLVFRANNGTGVFGPSWGAPFGQQSGDDNLRTWMFQGGEDRFWNAESPSAVNWNGRTIGSGGEFDMSSVASSQGANMDDYMILKVTAGPENNLGVVRSYNIGTRMDGWADSRFATAELLAYDHELSAEQENSVGYYLANKYGIATTYVAAPPQPYTLPNPVLDLSGTAVNLQASTTLHVKASQTDFSGLTLENGVVTLEGPADGITFNGTTFAGASVGIATSVNVSSGAIDGGGLGATLVKSGTADLIVQGAGSNLAGATIDVQAGRLIAIHGSNPLGTATLQISGGETILASAGGNVTYDNPVTVTADGQLTLGAGGVGAAGPLELTLGNAGSGIALSAGTLTLETTDSYQLIVPGTITGAGNIDIIGTSVQTAQGISGGTVGIANTSLATSSNITASGTLTLNGGTITSNGTLTISSTAGNVSVTGTPNLTIAAGGHLTTFGGDSLGPLTYDFESGDLSGWTDVGTSFGPDNLFNSGNNPVSHGRMGGEQGSWYIDGYRTQANQNSDGHSGILESDSFLLGPGASISFLVGGGSSNWSGDPDSPVANLKGIGIERQVAPGDWENIHWESCGNCNTFQARNWDGSAYAGDTLRVRVYDTHTGGWGWTGLDNLQISSVRDLTVYGALTMEAGAQLTLDDGTGPGNGSATFSAITTSTGPAINGNVIVSGSVIIDSNSPETLTVTGNYTQGDGSTLHWDIDTGTADLINASGSVDGTADWNLEINPHAAGLTINGTALMTGSAPPAAPGTVTVTLTGLYASVYTLTAPTVTQVGNSLVINGVDPVPPSISEADGDWNQAGTWDATGVPTIGPALVDGETVTVANAGATASTVIVSGGTLAVQQDLTVTTTVQVGDTATLSVTGASGVVTATEVLLTDGATLHMDNGGTVTAGNIDLGSGATLRSSGTQTIPGNLTVDAASTIDVVSGTLSVNAQTMPAGLEAWFDASAGVTVNGSNDVTNWADQSGNGRDAVTYQGTGRLTASEVNGLPAVLFGENENLQITGSAFFAYDTFLVFRSDSGNGVFGPNGGGWGSPFGPQDLGNDNHRSWMFDGGDDRFWNGETPGAVNWNGYAINSVNTFDMSAVVGAQGSDMADYMVLKVTAGSANNLGVVRPYTIGTRNDQWSNLKFATAEAMAFNRALNADEENDVGGYLARKYGISSAYTGALAVEYGNLQVTSGANFQNTGSSAVSVAGLSGTGTVVSDTIVRGQVTPGGAGIGTLSVTGSLALDAAATSFIDVISPQSDSVAVNGNLDISGATLDVQYAGSSGVFVIATYTGNLNGTFASSNIPAAWIDYNYAGGTAIAVNIPFIGTVIRIR